MTMKYLKSAFSFVVVMPAVIIVFTGTGCAQSPDRSAMGTQTYTSKDTLIRASVGVEFSIILDSNPTTGYSWDFSSPPDEGIIKLIDDAFQPPTTQLKGAGGKQLWTFRPVGEGMTTIALKYLRPWEKDTPPVRTKTFTVIVEKAPGIN